MSDLKSLHLNVTARWFEQAKSGEKVEEYREITPYWTKRLVDKEYKDIQYKLGYPKKEDDSKTLVYAWRGYRVIKGFVHPHFDNVPTDVYAIKLEKAANE